MPISTPIQSATNTGSTNTLVLTLGSPPSDNNTLLLGVGTATGNSIVSISQTGATWFKAVNSSSFGAGELWYTKSLIGGGTTITITLGRSTDSVATVSEFSGIVTPYLDQTASNAGSSGNPDSGTTPTTTHTNELWFGFLAQFPGGTNTFLNPTNGFTNINTVTSGDGNILGGSFYKIVSSKGKADVSATVGPIPVFGDWISTGAPLPTSLGNHRPITQIPSFTSLGTGTLNFTDASSVSLSGIQGTNLYLTESGSPNSTVRQFVYKKISGTNQNSTNAVVPPKTIYGDWYDANGIYILTVTDTSGDPYQMTLTKYSTSNGSTVWSTAANFPKNTGGGPISLALMKVGGTLLVYSISTRTYIPSPVQTCFKTLSHPHILNSSQVMAVQVTSFDDLTGTATILSKTVSHNDNNKDCFGSYAGGGFIQRTGTKFRQILWRFVPENLLAGKMPTLPLCPGGMDNLTLPLSVATTPTNTFTAHNDFPDPFHPTFCLDAPTTFTSVPLGNGQYTDSLNITFEEGVGYEPSPNACGTCNLFAGGTTPVRESVVLIPNVTVIGSMEAILVEADNVSITVTSLMTLSTNSLGHKFTIGSNSGSTVNAPITMDLFGENDTNQTVHILHTSGITMDGAGVLHYDTRQHQGFFYNGVSITSNYGPEIAGSARFSPWFGVPSVGKDITFVFDNTLSQIQAVSLSDFTIPKWILSDFNSFAIPWFTDEFVSILTGSSGTEFDVRQTSDGSLVFSKVYTSSSDFNSMISGSGIILVSNQASPTSVTVEYFK